MPVLATQRRFAGPDIREGDVRAVFLIEEDQAAIAANMRQRSRGFSQRSPTEQQTQVRASWLYGQWLAREAERIGLPVLSPRPWETLLERLQGAIGIASQ